MSKIHLLANPFTVAIIAMTISGCEDEPSFTPTDSDMRVQSHSTQIQRDEHAPINIESLMEATKYWLSDNKDVKLRVMGREYREVKDRTRTVNSNVLYKVYNYFSLRENANYYVVEMNATSTFGDIFTGIYSTNVPTNGCYTIAKVYEWYGSEVTLKLDINAQNSDILENKPETTQEDKMICTQTCLQTSSVLGYKQGPDIEARPGMMVTTGISTTIKGVKVENYGSAHKGQHLEWQYKLADPIIGGSWYRFWESAATVITPVCACGTSTFQAPALCAFSIPYKDGDKAPTINVAYKIKLASVCGKCGFECGRRTKAKEYTRTLTLPMITRAEAEEAARKAHLL